MTHSAESLVKMLQTQVAGAAAVRGGFPGVGGDNQEVFGDELSHCHQPSLVETMTKGGVLVDVCKTCKGVWLDRGEVFFFSRKPKELEQLLASETTPSRCRRAAIARAAGCSLAKCRSCGPT